jgi:hypothetical protein
MDGYIPTYVLREIDLDLGIILNMDYCNIHLQKNIISLEQINLTLFLLWYSPTDHRQMWQPD